MGQATEPPQEESYDWSRLRSPQTVGYFGELAARQAFLRWGMEVYATEVDDAGVDFLARTVRRTVIEVQVKTARVLTNVYFEKRTELRESLVLVPVVLLPGKAPELFVIPSLTWRDDLRAPLYGSDYDKETQTSPPEWGVRLSKSALEALGERFPAERQLEQLAVR